MEFAPRIAYRVRLEIERLAASALTAAEITRIVGATAEELGFRRPSYQQVRALVREHRDRPRPESTATFLLDALYRPGLYHHYLAGVSTPVRRK